MAKPATLCKLSKGTVIDAHQGFVDTWNWLVDFANNLSGDNQNIKVTNPTGTNPVVRFIGKAAASQSSGITVNIGGTDYPDVTNLKFESASDSAVTFAAAQDDNSLTVTIGVHYAD